VARGEDNQSALLAEGLLLETGRPRNLFPGLANIIPRQSGSTRGMAAVRLAQAKRSEGYGFGFHPTA
jgi:hypothetical protein